MRLSRLMFFVSLFGTAALGCNEAPLRAAPDAGNPCLGGILEYPCRPQAATLPGCAPDLQSGGPPLYRDEVLDGGSFPVGCAVIVNDPVPDLDSQCSQLGTCRCTSDDAGMFSWDCVN